MAILNKQVKSNTNILDIRRTQTCIQVRITKICVRKQSFYDWFLTMRS